MAPRKHPAPAHPPRHAPPPKPPAAPPLPPSKRSFKFDAGGYEPANPETISRQIAAFGRGTQRLAVKARRGVFCLRAVYVASVETPDAFKPMTGPALVEAAEGASGPFMATLEAEQPIARAVVYQVTVEAVLTVSDAGAVEVHSHGSTDA